MSNIRLAVSQYEGFLNEKAKIAWVMANNSEVINWLETNKTRNTFLPHDQAFQRIITNIRTSVDKDMDINSAFIASEKAKFYWDESDKVRDPASYFVDVRPWYINVKQQAKPVWDVSLGYTDKKILLNYRNPVFNDNKDFIGVTGIDFQLTDVDRFFKNLNIFETAQTFLFNQDGTVLFHENIKNVLKINLNEFTEDNKKYKDIQAVVDDIEARKPGIRRVVFEGENRFFMYSTFQSLDWTLLLSVSANEINQPLTKLSSTFFWIVFGSLLLLTVIIFFIASSIASPIQHIASVVDDISQGERDLTRRINIHTRDEIGNLAAGFNTFVSKLHGVIVQVRDNSNKVALATHEISTTSQEMAKGSEEQTNQTGLIAASIEQMTTAIFETSKNATQAAAITETASSKAREGAVAIQQTQKEMDEIVTATQKAENIITKLSEKANEIEGILMIINGIADQTKLLALNASIEASRAGEQGKGFSVVAEEVRKLAKMTSKATTDISVTIKTIQEDTLEAYNSMQSANKVVMQGKEVTDQTENIFNEIIKSVEHAQGVVKEIDTATEQMSTGAHEISENIKSMRDVTKESAKGTEVLASSVLELSLQTDELDALINQFKL